MLTDSDYRGNDALQLAASLRNKDFSCVELVSTAISNAEKLNPAINAIVAEGFEQALEQARQFDANPQMLQYSALAGIPFLIKDLTPIRGMSCQRGSRLFQGDVAEQDANIVTAYRQAGLIFLGKTNTPELGLTITTEPQSNGPCHNPWQHEYSTGGSSGGAAAAVSAGIVPAAHATDGGGSIRIPASCCGLVGLKPSRGLTPVQDSLAESWSGMSAHHVVSQSVADSAAFLDVVALKQPMLYPLPAHSTAFTTSIEKPVARLRIALQTNHPFALETDATCRAAVEECGVLLQSLGHHVETIDKPLDYKAPVSAMGKLICLHTYQALKQQLELRNVTLDSANLEHSTRSMAKIGAQMDADSYVAARDTLREAELAMAAFHGQYDVILSPVLSKPPVKLGWLDMNAVDEPEYARRFRAWSGFTALYNGTGQPSISIPFTSNTAGLPIGVMCSAAWGNDSLLLQLASQLEQARPWARLAPVT